ncbi:hypothetical protein CSIM01_05827 [Colletotrichum simmondsii]|uniref:DNA/RNA-binding protein Alba-like domain-containing protein n=1 Tax=Colletotrichum simmondsii TaxID=703756 RepID=A0A135S8B1_9PEZI|nr:hypothetical protein CSIM01_05827 [Colletotrichum simmondsii]
MAEPSATQPKGDDKKRKSSTAAADSSAAVVSKKSKATETTTKTTTTNTSASASSNTNVNGPTTPLSPSHEALLADLRSKYDVLPAFTISSTKIQKRVTWLLQHLRKDDGDPRRRVVLVYARLGEVAKMISIVETVKRIVAAEKKSVDGKEGEESGGKWYQYNLMYELPPKPDVVEDTVLGGGGGGGGTQDGSNDDDGDDDDFEVMESRFERAVLPQPTKRAAKSLSIFLSLAPVPELKARGDVTTQTNTAQ